LSAAVPHTGHCFNPRSRARERHFLPSNSTTDGEFQSTLPCEGATQGPSRRFQQPSVSIHAPVRGSDRLRGWKIYVEASFNPRSRARERPRTTRDKAQAAGFNPRSRARERPQQRFLRVTFHDVSIHAPVRGSDPRLDLKSARISGFQSTLPCEGATLPIAALRCRIEVSIHAPVRGSDTERCHTVQGKNRFNPRSRARERPRALGIC